MRLPLSLILILTAQCTVYAATHSKRSYDTHHYYVLQHDPQLTSLAEVVDALGVELVEQAGELVNHWLVRSKRFSDVSEARDLESNHVLRTFHELKAREHALRSIPLHSRSTEDHTAHTIARSINHLSLQTLKRRTKRAPPPIRPEDSSRGVALRLGIEDPLFPDQWHLVNDDFPEHMMNCTGVWELGYTGKGVHSSFVDDGLDYNSDDIKDNFDAKNSYDFNDHEDLPTPKLSDDHHGTRCAGQVAAGKNGVCGLGIAYESRVSGVRILSGAITDVDEAAALNYGYQEVDIYSCSWGPPDNGQSMEGPAYLIRKAVVNGINNGRGGKGSIFVFASGNGAGYSDQCNFDGYTNSIYSVTVSAIDYKGLHPYYSEPCAANLVVAYSSGSGKHIVTTDVGKNQCARTHGGTSAAAPNAVGVLALAIEARPDLTWRDIQYLCIETARIVNPDDPDWERIANGHLYSYKYGYGSLDAYAYVTAALNWKLVTPQTWFRTPSVRLGDGAMDAEEGFSGGEFIPRNGIDSKIMVTREMLDTHNFDKLEHINIQVWIDHSKRGDIEVSLTSPNGFESILAAPRSRDSAKTGYPGWTFMSVKHWGENPIGEWTIHVSDQKNHAKHNGSFIGWNMLFWGSTVDPAKATKFELLADNDIWPFPPLDEIEDANPPTPSSTIYAKPTAHLPGDHGEAEGENSSPAFSSTPTQSGVSATPDEGWFPGLSNLVTSQKWFFGAVGAVALFGVGAAVFFWRRRVEQLRRAGYGTVPAEDGMGMRTLSQPVTGTRELYDAFGEVSDEDDEDADEQTGLRPQARRDAHHDGFSDENRGRSAATPYRDEPGSTRPAGSGGPSSPSGSGDGSWEHAP
ncbi:hypothetical protein BDN72DRAFT_954035 [Pluteus cervinus]|uniref:Uncharacterized protein n=1 Tax=Pluteus cervinus TaxID=181527 RepID=A0ACD3BF25_9AGAR|nr:hypothetical protein BDN72DRAFT_954035 [Pluteus cervinus]